MTPKEVEDKLIELIHREPFAPFELVMADGQSVKIVKPGLAVNGGGAGFIGPDGGLVDIEFKNVRAIRATPAEAAA